MTGFGDNTALNDRRRDVGSAGAFLRCDSAEVARIRRALATVALCLLAAPLHAQGAGPPDLGAFGYVILGMWLFFWIGVFVYPIALAIYFIQRQSDARAEEQDDEYIVPARGEAILRRSVIVHVVLTLAALLVFVFG